jgi:hypothetical protein
MKTNAGRPSSPLPMKTNAGRPSSPLPMKMDAGRPSSPLPVKTNAGRPSSPLPETMKPGVPADKDALLRRPAQASSLAKVPGVPGKSVVRMPALQSVPRRREKAAEKEDSDKTAHNYKDEGEKPGGKR